METKGYYLEDSTEKKVNLTKTNRVLSVAGGAFLLTSGVKNLYSPSIGNLLRLVGGAYLIYRGSKGYCPITEALNEKGKVLNIRETMVINRPKEEVYALWRNLENLPRFMKHLAEVKILNENRSIWKAKIPGGLMKVEWEAEILLDRKGSEISWRSVEGSMIDNSGKVVFTNTESGSGTVLNVTISYSPPAGDVGKAIGKLLNNTFEDLIRQDLRGFKQMAENIYSQTIDLNPKQFYN
ncbi:MAG: SRPBCC family protein [Opitutaceae bacterium]|nr:SRPBCC family protein [Cytophagales bacterium]